MIVCFFPEIASNQFGKPAPEFACSNEKGTSMFSNWQQTRQSGKSTQTASGLMGNRRNDTLKTDKWEIGEWSNDLVSTSTSNKTEPQYQYKTATLTEETTFETKQRYRQQQQQTSKIELDSTDLRQNWDLVPNKANVQMAKKVAQPGLVSKAVSTPAQRFSESSISSTSSSVFSPVIERPTPGPLQKRALNPSPPSSFAFNQAFPNNLARFSPDNVSNFSMLASERPDSKSSNSSLDNGKVLHPQTTNLFGLNVPIEKSSDPISSFLNPVQDSTWDSPVFSSLGHPTNTSSSLFSLETGSLWTSTSPTNSSSVWSTSTGNSSLFPDSNAFNYSNSIWPSGSNANNDSVFAPRKPNFLSGGLSQSNAWQPFEFDDPLLDSSKFMSSAPESNMSLFNDKVPDTSPLTAPPADSIPSPNVFSLFGSPVKSLWSSPFGTSPTDSLLDNSFPASSNNNGPRISPIGTPAIRNASPGSSSTSSSTNLSVGFSTNPDQSNNAKH